MWQRTSLVFIFIALDTPASGYRAWWRPESSTRTAGVAVTSCRLATSRCLSVPRRSRPWLSSLVPDMITSRTCFKKMVLGVGLPEKNITHINWYAHNITSHKTVFCLLSRRNINEKEAILILYNACLWISLLFLPRCMWNQLRYRFFESV